MRNILFLLPSIFSIFFIRTLCFPFGCLPSSSLCNCMPYQIYRNGSCNTCSIPNCRLCSFQNQLSCDLCEPSYVLDSLTKSSCHPKINKPNECSPTQNRCSPFEIEKNGQCLNCTADNCLLCSSQSTQECDICQKGFILDKLTKSTCLKANNTLVCAQQKDYRCICQPFQSRIKGKCFGCPVSNCLLCSLDKPNQCDVCQKGYILDTLTKSQCYKIQSPKLQCNQVKFKCSPFEKYENEHCQKCQVRNCKLCSLDNFSICDICDKPFLLNLTNRKCEPPICQEKRTWNGSSCGCDLSLKLIEIDGTCSLTSSENQLALLLGFGFPLIVIVIGVIFILKIQNQKNGQLINGDEYVEDDVLEGKDTPEQIKIGIENIEIIK